MHTVIFSRVSALLFSALMRTVEFSRVSTLLLFAWLAFKAPNCCHSDYKISKVSSCFTVGRNAKQNAKLYHLVYSE
jgi:hypothetical protein